MIQFKNVRNVQPDERVRAENFNELALAYNQRLLAGAGDPTWRIFWYAHSLIRQVRNPSGDGIIPYAQAWPASDEWWKLYAHTGLSLTCGNENIPWSWPQTGPGEPEGANVANPLMAFQFGREPNVNREQTILTETLPGNPAVPLVPLGGNEDDNFAQMWATAKDQRGWVETASPYRATAPAVERAHAHLGWHYGSFAPYLKSYSTLSPVPPGEGHCPEYQGIEAVRWTMRFTPLVPGLPVLEFPTCPGQEGSAYLVSRLYDRYIVWIQDGDPVVLPYTLYLEGPYAGGGNLTRPDSEILTQSMNQFLVDFRGTLADKVRADYQIELSAFDNQRLLSTQYALAPSAGGIWNPTTEQVEGDDGYPTFKLTNTTGSDLVVPAETPLEITQGSDTVGGTIHSFRASFFVLGAIYVTWANVVDPGEIALVNAEGTLIDFPVGFCGGVAVGVWSQVISAAGSTRKARALYFPNAFNPGSVSIRIKGAGLKLASTGYIQVELLEQAAYIPDVTDAYFVMRLGLTTGDDTNPDSYGDTITASTLGGAQGFSQNYFKYGCVYNIHGKSSVAQNDTFANWNAVYEGARKLINNNLRMVKREQIRGYELDENSNSVLYFRRPVVQAPNADPGVIQTDEVEIKGTSVSAKVNVLTSTTPRPEVAYLLTPKTGTDNVKPVMTQVGSGSGTLAGRYPSFTYSEKYEGNERFYCDNFVVYNNQKYVLPGYNIAQTPGLSTGSLPWDADKGYTNRLVGLTPSVTPIWSQGDPVGDVAVEVSEDLSHPTSYYDSMNQLRKKTFQSKRIYWIPKTTYAGGGWEYTTITVKKAKQNAIELTSTGSASEGGLTADTPQQDLTFKYFNGVRYMVERSTFNGSIWSDWVKVFTSPASSIANLGSTYSFDPAYKANVPQNAGGFAETSGWFFVDDPEAYGKTVGTSGLATIKYRIFATPVVDFNQDNLQLVQEAYFTPRRLTWSGVPSGAAVRVARKQTMHGSGVETTTRLQATTNFAYFVDPLTALCPINHGGAAWDTLGTYSLEYSADNWQTVSTGTVTATIVDHLIPKANYTAPLNPGDLVGEGDVNLNLNTTQRGFCNPARGPSYKVYGPEGSYISYILPAIPAAGNGGPAPQAEVIKGVGDIFGWFQSFSETEKTNTATPGIKVIHPAYPSKNNFNNLTFHPGPGASDPVNLTKDLPQIFQYSNSCTLLAPEELIERVAGCDIAYPLQVVVYVGGVPTVKDVQWTEWDPVADYIIATTSVTHYTLKTGYERMYLSLNYIQAGDYIVRGTGSITYKTVVYGTGAAVKITSDDLSYTVSSPFVRLVQAISYACNDTSFDYFDGVAPNKSLALSDIIPGEQYITFGGKGLKLKMQVGETFVLQSHAPDPITPFQFPVNVTEIIQEDGANPTAIRPIDGIRHKAPPKGYSNEWSLFLSFNHYHTSDSSIWKTEAYGDQMAFLHNRCHTYSNEIKAPWNADLSKHFAYGGFPVMVSEAPPGYTYLKDINRAWYAGADEETNPNPSGLNKGYYKSCQVYKPNLAMQSVTIAYRYTGAVDPATGFTKYDDSEIKVVLDGRLHHCENATVVPQHTARGSLLTNTQLASLQSEPYRTDENGLREYLHFTRSGINCRPALGDSSTSYDVFSLPDGPFGCCHPRFYLTKHIPYVHEKTTNAGAEVDVNQDTKMTVDAFVQMDLYLRAMVGGWLDLESITGISCNNKLGISTVGDYLYENLCYQACKPAGAIINIKPKILAGAYYLPHSVVSQYSFTGFSVPADTKLKTYYRNNNPDGCSLGDWTSLDAALISSEDFMPLGGIGYGLPPGVVVTTSTGQGATFTINYSTTTGPASITSIHVDTNGSGYVSGDTAVLSGVPVVAGALPALTLTISGDQIQSVAVAPHSPMFASPMQVYVEGLADPLATVAVRLTDPLQPSSIKSVDPVNVDSSTPALSNQLFFSTPTITLVGGGGTGAQLKAILDPTKVADSPFGALLFAIEVVPVGSNTPKQFNVTHQGGLAYTTNFRFKKASDDTTVTATESKVNQVIYPFLRDPSKYSIFRARVKTTTSCAVVPPMAVDSTFSRILDNSFVGGCENNVNRTSYDNCTDSCLCPWPDNDSYLLDTPNEYLADIYLIKDESITDTGPDAGRTYYLDWLPQALTKYSVQRQMLYKYGTMAEWQTLATGVLSPYVDEVTKYPTHFEKEITVSVDWSEAQVEEVQLEGEGSTWLSGPREVIFKHLKSSKRYTVRKSIVVLLSRTTTLSGGTVDQTAEYDMGTDEIGEMRYNDVDGTPKIENLGNHTYSDTSSYIEYPNFIKAKYRVVHRVAAGLKWHQVDNNEVLVVNKAHTNITYTLVRTAVPSSAVTTVPDLYSTAPSGKNVNAVTWGGDDQVKPDDLTFESISFKMFVSWNDEAGMQTVNNPASQCGVPGAGTYTIDRLYRVQAMTQRKHRWFTTMPLELNVHAPQGYSPLPNTCSYAEIFNNFANCINKLTYVRLELPFLKQARIINRSSLDLGSTTRDTTRGHLGTKTNVCGTATPFVSYSPWAPVGIESGGEASRSINPSHKYTSDNPYEVPAVQTESAELQFGVVPNQECLNALPTSLRGNFNGEKDVLFVGSRIDHKFQHTIVSEGANRACADYCGGAATEENPDSGADRSFCSSTNTPYNNPNFPAFRNTNGSGATEDPETNFPYARAILREVDTAPPQCVIMLEGKFEAPGLGCGDMGWITQDKASTSCEISPYFTRSTLSGARSMTYMHFPLY